MKAMTGRTSNNSPSAMKRWQLRAAAALGQTELESKRRNVSSSTTANYRRGFFSQEAGQTFFEHLVEYQGAIEEAGT